MKDVPLDVENHLGYNSCDDPLLELRNIQHYIFIKVVHNDIVDKITNTINLIYEVAVS